MTLAYLETAAIVFPSPEGAGLADRARLRCKEKSRLMMACLTAKEGNMLVHRAVHALLLLGLVAALAGAEEPRAAVPKHARVDRHGDPLPAGAVARLGTSRLRPGDYSASFALSPDGRTMLTGEPGWLRLWDVESGKEVRAIGLPDRLRPDGLAFSTDGNLIVAVADTRRHAWVSGEGDESWAFLADVRSGKLLHKLGDGKASSAVLIAETRYVLIKNRLDSDALDSGPEISIWDHHTGKKLRTLTRAWSVSCSPDGKHLATSHEDGTVQVWGTAGWRQHWTFKVPDSGVRPLLFSPDGRYLAGAVGPPWHGAVDRQAPPAFGYAVLQWDLRTGEEVQRLLGAPGPIRDLAFSPDISMLLARARSPSWQLGSTLVWDLRTGTLRTCLADTVGSACAFSPDSKRLYSLRGGGLDDIDLASGKVLSKNSVPGWFGDDLRVTANVRWVVCGGNGLHVWDRKTGKEIHAGEGHCQEISSLFFSPDGQTLLSLAKFGDPRLWDMRANRLLPRFVPAPTTDVCACAFQTDHRTVATVDREGMLRLWDRSTGSLVRTTNLGTELAIGWPMQFHSLFELPRGGSSFSPDGRKLAVRTTDRLTALWDVASGKLAGRLDTGGFTLLRWSPDGRRLVTLRPREMLALWDGQTCKRLAQAQGWFFDFSPDGSRVAWGSGSTVHLLDCVKGKELSRFVLPGEDLELVVFLPNGRGLLAFGGDPDHFLDLATGKKMRCEALSSWDGLIRGPDGRVLKAGNDLFGPGVPVPHEVLTGRPIGNLSRDEVWNLSPDGRLLVAGSHVIRLMETATGREVATLPSGHRGGITALAFSPDGRTLATGGADSTILLWDRDALRARRSPRRDASLPDLWKDLAAVDPAIGWGAIEELAAKPREAIRLLKEQLKPIRKEDAAPLQRRFLELDDRRFDVRQKATEEMKQTPAEWEFVFREALLAQPGLELRRRLEQVRAVSAAGQFSAETVRALRGVQVLERIGTAEARSLLKQIAEGLPEARLTQDANDALQRQQRQDKQKID
jgi:WD40 repeat protein